MPRGSNGFMDAPIPPRPRMDAPIPPLKKPGGHQVRDTRGRDTTPFAVPVPRERAINPIVMAILKKKFAFGNPGVSAPQRGNGRR